MSKSIVITSAGTEGLRSSPITPDWVINGRPQTRSRELARSHDRTSHAMVWDCTAGCFNWHYSKDETLVVLHGEAFITDGDGKEHRIGAGDIVFFPAGTTSKWHVPEYIRKVAFLRHTMPRPVGFGVLAWNLFRRLVLRTGGSPLVMTLLCDSPF